MNLPSHMAWLSVIITVSSFDARVPSSTLWFGKNFSVAHAVISRIDLKVDEEGSSRTFISFFGR